MGEREMKTFVRATRLVLFGGLLCIASMASAQERACAGDVERFCKDVPAGAGQRHECLSKHLSELSSDCKKRVEAAAQGWPCLADAEKFCKGIEAGEGRIRKCLRQHGSELSDACKKHVGEEKAKP